MRPWRYYLLMSSADHPLASDDRAKLQSVAAHRRGAWKIVISVVVVSVALAGFSGHRPGKVPNTTSTVDEVLADTTRSKANACACMATWWMGSLESDQGVAAYRFRIGQPAPRPFQA